jgi:CRP/FNR family cyclic AMP-dependent transcriptional regulator
VKHAGIRQINGRRGRKERGMQTVDVLGYMASLLVVVTFYAKDMIPLRGAALCSNLLFLSYGLSMQLGPVALLHATLIPINAWRLSQALYPDASLNLLSRLSLKRLSRVSANASSRSEKFS